MHFGVPWLQGDKARERAARLSRLQRLVTGAVEDEGEEDEESSDDSEEQGLDWRAKHVA